MNVHKHIITSLLLLLFGAMQLGELHVLDHASDDSDCMVCEYVSGQNHNDFFVLVEEVSVPETIDIPAESAVYISLNTTVKTITFSKLHNKAPPVA
ncbi:hypothetical protein HN014_06695 [Aquimarina sp. TRL1]|uniref:hypothetical protein n=1 Tax=Aquimarina sp. (strain TRL1) TaxID=2736252 RepID=UPI00158C01E1|nr:hypothetical protein [Aquimarina sp. TRL1]QKX04612.1 hypothetical protein HN014_06695 [Aquimarina sp. TRL1]